MNAPALSLQRRRSEAEERVRAHGLPHRRIEEWKYSDLRSRLDAPLSPAGALQWRLEDVPPGVEHFDLAGLDGGAPDWVARHFGRLSADDAMSEASFAYARSGVALRVPAGLTVERPVRLHRCGAGHGRILLVVEAGAALTVTDARSNTQVQLRNVGTEIAIGEGARLVHVCLAMPGDASSTSVDEISVTVGKDAEYRAHLFTEGAGLSRLEFRIALNGARARAHLSGAAVLGGSAHADVTTHIRHAVADTESTQLFKYVAGGRARGIYQGKITVAQGADGSDSRQTAKALLLGERAEVDLKPELEIFADDVKCAHGAAVGDLDADSLFYLRSRGVSEAEARGLLIHAFLDDAFMGIEDDSVRETMLKAAEAALPRALGDET
jgi:Fe-S cluster assembly protein SufD